MKKRALAILMILVLATAGLFATYTVTVPTDVTATLKATIGEYFYHGFNDGTTKYKSSIEVLDAFNATTPPSFKYGYKTNAATGSFTLNMTVADFLNGSVGTVKIKDVIVSGGGALSHSAGSRVYEIFSHSGTGVEKVDEKTITIKPFLVYSALEATDITGATITATQAADGAPSGEYTALVTFNISAV